MPSTPPPSQKRDRPSVPACPKCKQVFVRRVLPKKGWEHLLWHLYLYPFRCQLCTHRFFALRLGQRYRIELDDMREYERLRVTLPVTFTGGPVKGTGVTVDITMKGCWIDCPQRVMVSKGMTIALKIQDSGKGLPIEIESGMVRWALGRGIGVEFLNVKPNHLDRLRALIKTAWEQSQRDDVEVLPSNVTPIKQKVRAQART